MRQYQPATRLEPGATVVIVCTARFALAPDLAPAVEQLQLWGFNVRLGATIGLKDNQLGGTQEQRIADFVTAYTDPAVQAIWIARGGYGTIQIIDQVLEQLAPAFTDPHFKHPLIIGYSDVTVLHTTLQKQGLQSIHAFMPLEIAKKPLAVLDSLHAALTGTTITTRFKNEQQLAPQQLVAPVVGGNLSILYSLLGSQILPDFNGHILFIEDVDEYLYHIERMLYALKRAGKLHGLKALLVGGMTAMRDHEVPFGKTAHEILQDLTAGSHYPVVLNFPAGHVPDNHSMILGKEMHLHIDPLTITCTQSWPHTTT